MSFMPTSSCQKRLTTTTLTLKMKLLTDHCTTEPTESKAGDARDNEAFECWTAHSPAAKQLTNIWLMKSEIWKQLTTEIVLQLLFYLKLLVIVEKERQHKTKIWKLRQQSRTMWKIVRPAPPLSHLWLTSKKTQITVLARVLGKTFWFWICFFLFFFCFFFWFFKSANFTSWFGTPQICTPT